MIYVKEGKWLLPVSETITKEAETVQGGGTWLQQGEGRRHRPHPSQHGARMASSRSSCSFFSFSLACSSRATLFLVSTTQQHKPINTPALLR